VAVLDRAQIDSLLATPGQVTFIDVRRADEVAAIGSLPVFLNIQSSELDRFLDYIPRDRPVVTLSNHAGRARRAAAVLAEHGFHVAGAAGVQDYQDQGGTLYGRLYTTPAIAGVVAAGTRVEVVREGFAATEGPVVLADGALAFTENSANRVVRIGTDDAVSTLVPEAGGPNALAIDAQGAILAVQTTSPAIAVIAPQPRVLAAAYEGKPFNRINDLALSRSGHVYFSDPGVVPQSPPGQPRIAPATAFYHLDPAGGVHLVTTDIPRPNGVVLSPDERILYVADSWGEHLLAYDVAQDGSLSGRRNFARLAGFAQLPEGPTSGADGIAVDAEGRVYVATRAGIEVFNSGGAPLGVIALPKQPQNLAFAGEDRSALYAVGRGSVFRIATQTRGVDRPGK
jgi:gluconolactonase